MNGRALCALGFCAFSVPAVLYLPSVGWLWAGIAAVGGALFLAVLVWLRRRAQLDLIAVCARSGVGKGVLCLLVGWDLLLLGAAAGHLCSAFPVGNAYPVVGLFLLLMAVWAAGKGVAARVSAITFFFLVGLYGLILAFALPQTRWEVPPQHLTWTQLPAALSPVCVLFLCRSDAEKTRVWPWLCGGVLLAVLCALVCTGIVSDFPFYTMTQSLTVFGVVERFEPLISVALIAGGFCLLALLCRVNGRVLEVLLPQSRRSFAACLNFSLGCFGFWVSRLLPPTFIAAGTAIFWGAAPLGILLVANLKKFKKIEKKC